MQEVWAGPITCFRFLLVYILSFFQKRAWRDSNPRPSEPESDALSTELHAPIGVDYKIYPPV